jgi:hypothetical protein
VVDGYCIYHWALRLCRQSRWGLLGSTLRHGSTAFTLLSLDSACAGLEHQCVTAQQ